MLTVYSCSKVTASTGSRFGLGEVQHLDVLLSGSSGAVAYQQTVLDIPGRVVAVKLRHDAHLSSSSHLFGMPGF
ncbi:hypothetical protein EVAR_68678_1 [Eumeta japonica]|uniref:Uncharacterized protein n=1 Tax=Eumeta variegata TaxID=151549 RepID=A0A4C1TQ62_EUMVA|nr:hypothetical protein EVAR_68678_1 [Eumeta japonica]